MGDFRYTDRPPPPQVLAEFANWVHALGEEGRRGQDESTIRPQRRQKRIDDQTKYTAADIWLAGESETVGLVWLSEGQPCGVTVYDGGSEWRILASTTGGPWLPLGPVPEGRLPLRYCTRLPYGRRPLKGHVAADGTWSVWLLEGE